MGFKFNLEAVLKYRGRIEEAAQREFAEAQARVDAVLRELEAMYTRIDEVREEISGTQKDGSAKDLESVRQMEDFLIGHKIRIEHKRQDARELLLVAEQKQEELIKAAQERKILVKLKDKRLVEYRAWLNQIEVKLADDQTTMTRARVQRG